MNRYLLLLLALLPFSAFAQLDITISILDARQAPLSQASVTLLELGSRAVVSGKTDAKGEVRLRLTLAGQWQVQVNGQKQDDEPIVLEEGESGSASFLYTFNPKVDKRKSEQRFDRKGFTETRVARIPDEPAEGHNRIAIEVRNSKGEALAGRRVALAQVAGKKTFVAQTDAAGIALFHLPGRTHYDIDVEEQLNAAYLLLEDRVNYNLQQTVIYDSYQLPEVRKGDTIIQSINTPPGEKASRALFRISVQRDDEAWKKGSVYLNEIGSNTVYQGRTNDSGIVNFVLPFGKKFLVHFPYQRDVDVVNLAMARQQAWGSLDLVYAPDPRLEHPEQFLPKPGELTLIDYRYYHQTPYRPKTPGSGPFLDLFQYRLAPDQAVLELGIGAPLNEQNRQPLNLAFVLDISGSMEGYERLERLKRGLEQLLSQLRASDEVAIILFNDRHQLLLPAQKLGTARGPIIEAVRGIQASGGTNMREALKAGYAEVMRHYEERKNNIVLVMTDGYDENPVSALLPVQAPYRNQVSCLTIGVGLDYNSELLRQLATNGQGSMTQAREGQELERFFGQQLLQLGLPAANSARLELQFDPALRIVETFGLRDVQVSGHTLKAELPRLYPQADQPYLVVFEHLGKKKDEYPATIHYTFNNPHSGERDAVQQETSIRFDAGANKRSYETAKIFAIASLNERIRAFSEAVQDLEWTQANACLEQGLALIRLHPEWEEDKDIRLIALALRQYQQVLKKSRRIP